MEVDRFVLEANDDTQNFFKQIKTCLLDSNLPNKNYEISKTNPLDNFEPIPQDQDPHTNFKHQHT